MTLTILNLENAQMGDIVDSWYHFEQLLKSR